MPNPVTFLTTYLRESREELRKVTWPNRKDTTRYSVVVIALCVVIAAFFGGLDWLLNAGLEQLIRATS